MGMEGPAPASAGAGPVVVELVVQPVRPRRPVSLAGFGVNEAHESLAATVRPRAAASGFVHVPALTSRQLEQFFMGFST